MRNVSELGFWKASWWIKMGNFRGTWCVYGHQFKLFSSLCHDFGANQFSNYIAGSALLFYGVKVYSCIVGDQQCSWWLATDIWLLGANCNGQVVKFVYEAFHLISFYFYYYYYSYHWLFSCIFCIPPKIIFQNQIREYSKRLHKMYWRI